MGVLRSPRVRGVTIIEFLGYLALAAMAVSASVGVGYYWQQRASWSGLAGDLDAVVAAADQLYDPLDGYAAADHDSVCAALATSAPDLYADWCTAEVCVATNFGGHHPTPTAITCTPGDPHAGERRVPAAPARYGRAAATAPATVPGGSVTLGTVDRVPWTGCPGDHLLHVQRSHDGGSGSGCVAVGSYIDADYGDATVAALPAGSAHAAVGVAPGLGARAAAHRFVLGFHRPTVALCARLGRLVGARWGPRVRDDDATEGLVWTNLLPSHLETAAWGAHADVWVSGVDAEADVCAPHADQPGFVDGAVFLIVGPPPGGAF